MAYVLQYGPSVALLIADLAVLATVVFYFRRTRRRAVIGLIIAQAMTVLAVIESLTLAVVASPARLVNDPQRTVALTRQLAPFYLAGTTLRVLAAVLFAACLALLLLKESSEVDSGSSEPEATSEGSVCRQDAESTS